LVYDGWSKIGVPITEAAAEEERKRKHQRTSGKASDTPVATNSRAKRGSQKLQNNNKGKNKANDTDAGGSDNEWELSSDQDASNEKVLDWCAYVNTFDVCIINYNTLRAELDVARAAPVRPRRDDVRYSERPQSPLVMCKWYRVIMDEVQMLIARMTSP
jgi:E3 ubiquitin-protein ligase SHPRH